MVCTACRVFEGNPVCGACKAGLRIRTIVGSGLFRAHQEEEVLRILRGATGALSDLVEENQLVAGAGSPQRDPEPPGGNTGPTPGPSSAKGLEGDKEEGTEYSYESSEEEKPLEAAEDEADWGSPGQEEEVKRSKREERPRQRRGEKEAVTSSAAVKVDPK